MADFPPSLIDAVKDQRAILFLGAGASHGALHPKNEAVPLGDKLRDLICDKFLGGQLKNRTLMAVAAMAANEAGLVQFQKYIHDLLEPFQPAPHHLLIPTFRWKTIVTTNYDLIVERAYKDAASPLQTLVKSVKNGDGFDARMSEATHPLGYYKLHGCIDHYTDESIPLILSNEQYSSYSKNRTRFYDRFRDLGYENSVIFAGYSIADPHIQQILFDLTSPDIGRPMYFNISPNQNDIEKRYWAKHRVTCIDATLEEFLRSMDSAIPGLARQLVTSLGGGTLSIRSHYKVASATESSSLRAYLDTDVTHLHAAMPAEVQDPKEFYRGNGDGWGCIQQNLDAKRSFSDSVLVDAVLIGDDSNRPSELFMLKGPAGNGKTVALKRIAWEAATTYEQLVFYVNNPAGLSLEPLAEVFQLTGKRVILCVDHVALFRTEVLALLKASKSRGVPLTILGTERDNEWHIYCEHLEPFVRQEFPVRYLNEREIEELLGLLERHHALGMLKDQSPQARVEAFVKNAERQLLVALHEITLGIPFENIVLDEFNRIEPYLARSVYLQICALHQFGAPVRAGLISRTSGIPFTRFKAEFLAPLQNVVHVIDDRHGGDVFYRARHQHVAEMVFRRAVPQQEDKFDLLASLVTALNVDYSSDRETFSRLIKGRGIQEIFPNIELGRLFYDRVDEASPNDPFVFHQRAVFELNHAGGSLPAAEAAARKAFELNPQSRSIKHTQGEIARRLANETDDPLKKEAYRRFAREKIGGELSKLGELDLYTRAKLSIDELREEVERADITPDGTVPPRFVEAVRDAETAIDRALQSYPDSPEIHAVEATFHEVLNQTKEAQAALEKAFRLNPRQDWLAVRLARRYQESGDTKKATDTLDICLRDNPSSKSARFAYARVLIDTNGDAGVILDHLKRAFTEGDSNYEAQFWYARQLFLGGSFADSQKIFDGVNSRAPGRFRNGSTGTIEASAGGPYEYLGRIERLEDSYAFVKTTQFPKALFASKADTTPEAWAAIRSLADVKCNVAFSRRGPRATNVRAA